MVHLRVSFRATGTAALDTNHRRAPCCLVMPAQATLMVLLLQILAPPTSFLVTSSVTEVQGLQFAAS